MNRRASKEVYTWHYTPPSTYTRTLDSRTKFVYAGWLLAAELDAINEQSPVLKKTYVWGKDLSGTPAGAGGIGGLLAVKTCNGVDENGAPVVTGIYWPVCDGNGNTVSLVDSGIGTGHTRGVIATFEYSPYGELLAVDATAASGISQANPTAICPMLFSTKYYDAEVGLYYYGYRYYEPGVGKWINRDPIAEEGGLNLYAFCGNDPVNEVDPLGLLTPGWHLRVTGQALDELGFAPEKEAKFRTAILVGSVYPDVPLPQTRWLVGRKMRPDEILEAVDAFNNHWLVKGYRGATATVKDYLVPDFLTDNVVVNDVRDWWNSTSIVDPAVEAIAWAWPGVKSTTMYRSHKGDLQYWHGMTGGGTAAQMNQNLLTRMGEPIDAFKTNPTHQDTGFAIGQVLHTIQDLYTPSHVVRNAKGEIDRFQDYGTQSAAYHSTKDVLDLNKPEDKALFRTLVDKTKEYLTTIKAVGAGKMNKKAFDAAMQSQYLTTIPGGPNMGGTAPEFAPRPSTTGKIIQGAADAAKTAGGWISDRAVDAWKWYKN
jgi:RHS repeat-associated protein